MKLTQPQPSLFMFRTRTGMFRLFLLVSCIIFLSLGALAQGVGIGTNSPAASAILDVSSGDMGVLFPRMTSAARELIDPDGPEHYGMIVFDTTRRMMYIYDYDNDYGEGRWKPLDAFWKEVSSGKIVAGESANVQIDAIGSEVLRVEASQRQVAGQFETFGAGYAYPTYGIISYVFNSSIYDKTGGRFDVWSTGDGAGRKTGVKSKVFGTKGENIGIHTDVEGDSSVNRAAWFERGDVIIEDRVLVGADTVYDAADPSALLELRSESSGILLPRMTSTQREAISSPAEGLHVYDTDLHKTYYFNGGTWEPVEGTGGGGGGSSPWNSSTHGIYYSAGNIGMGTVASADIKLSIDQEDEIIGLNLYSVSSSSDNQTGIYTYLSDQGSGLKTGILGQVYANTSSTSDVYGVRGEAHQSTSNARVYGIYGSVTGTGNGLRWAGYFDGDVNVAKQMRIGGGNFLPHESAILDLTSTDKGLLLPRMTASEREAISPLTYGLVVFDTDSLEAYLYNGVSGWSPLGGGSSASGLWSELMGLGVYYDGGQVGIGGYPAANKTLYITADDEDTGLYIYKPSGGAGDKYGAHIQVSAGTSGDNFGIQSTTFSNSSSTDVSYGVLGEVYQGTSPGSAVGVYGRVLGSGSGLRWAGFFDGDTKVSGILHSGSFVTLNDSGEFFTARSSSTGPKTISLEPNGSNGGSVVLANASGAIRAIMHGNEASGSLILYQGAAPMVGLYGDGDGDGGIFVKNKSNQETIVLNGENGRVTSKEIEITGGSDMAEYFSTSSGSTIEPGAVVVIDATHPGKVKLSSQAADKRVVGVVSGANGINPGMLMGQKESIAFGEIPVAIAGRVYVKTDDSGGNIGPGDFLTTSSVPGSARKVDDWETARGAIIGKALTYVDKNGFVLILVNLQ